MENGFSGHKIEGRDQEGNMEVICKGNEGDLDKKDGNG